MNLLETLALALALVGSDFGSCLALISLSFSFHLGSRSQLHITLVFALAFSLLSWATWGLRRWLALRPDCADINAGGSR